MIPFRSKSVTLSMLIDLLTSRCRSMQVPILVWSHQLTSDLKRCLIFRKCLRWSSLKAVSVPTSVIGGLRGCTATSDLVRFYCEERNFDMQNKTALGSRSKCTRYIDSSSGKTVHSMWTGLPFCVQPAKIFRSCKEKRKSRKGLFSAAALAIRLLINCSS